jgi:hypothetical protein
MGTAIVATAGVGLPLRLPGLRTACTVVWALALLLLVVLLTARVLHWRHHRDQARAHLLDPATAPFYGCLAMALLSVGGGALTLGRDWIGVRAALALDTVLFVSGTALGLVTAVAVPYLMAVRHRVEPGQASAVWLLPLVPPMVSAATGPLLVPHLPAGQPRQSLLFACFALFGLSLLATLVTLPLVFARLLTAGPPPPALTPTLFLVLGPLGQSTTAAGRPPGAVPRGPRRPLRPVRRAGDGLRAAVALPGHRSCGAGAAARHAVHHDVVVVHLPDRDLRHRRRGPRPAHGARRVRRAGRRPVRRPGGHLGRRGRAHGARAGQRRAARSARPSTRGARTSDGPYQVRCRPLTSAHGSPGKASGPSAAVKR